MNKKILSVLMTALFITSTALSDFSIELGAYGDIYAFSRNVVHGVKEDRDTAQVITTFSKPGFVPDFGGHFGIYYRVVEDVEVGLLSGVTYSLPFVLPLSKKVSGGEVDDTYNNNDAIGSSSYLTVPIQVGIRYLIVQATEKLSIYGILRGGVALCFDVAANTPAGYQRNLLGGMIDAGLGLEFYGIQFELFYGGQFLGGDYKTVADGAKDAREYSSHGICVGLGYIFRDIF